MTETFLTKYNMHYSIKVHCNQSCQMILDPNPLAVALAGAFLFRRMTPMVMFVSCCRFSAFSLCHASGFVLMPLLSFRHDNCLRFFDSNTMVTDWTRRFGTDRHG